MIVIKFIDEDGDEQIIEAKNLGDLGWQLDSWGFDIASNDPEILSVELVNK